MEKKQTAASLLVVEDDENLSYLLRENLESRGFHVQLCADGRQGLRAYQQSEPDLCILDVMLPFKDGFTLAKEIKEINKKAPIIFLTSRSMELDKIKGFEIGCDDYITKPFSIMELIMRVNAVLKRTSITEAKQEQDEFQIGKLKFNYNERKLLLPDGTEKSLSQKEADLLKIFGEKEGEMIQRNFLMNKVWGSDDYFIGKSMDVFITRLRKLLKADPALEIQNIYGTGFKMLVKKGNS